MDKMDEKDNSLYRLVNETPIIFLNCASAFNNLNNVERRYVHSLNRASWYGGLICLLQCSPESPGIFLLLQNIFRRETLPEFKRLAKDEGLTEDEVKAVLVYVAGFYGNLGNYLSFGDTKFVPNLPEEKFFNLIEATQSYKEDDAVRQIWQNVREAVFSLTPRRRQFGLGSEGLTTYYSANCNRSDAEIVQNFLTDRRISGYNTRLFKTTAESLVMYTVIQASAVNETPAGDPAFEAAVVDQATTVKLARGDYAEIMALMVEELWTVKAAALNTTEEDMWARYIESFTTGSIEEHRESSKLWIQDQGPIVENYIGFIESYRDPFGVRGEFESFVAIVNREMSAKFQNLVLAAPTILDQLPWPKSYERDTFLSPDFTSLDVVNFASSGIPAGINIPNYDDIRQTLGFKNLSLGNVIASRFRDPRVTFLKRSDRELYLHLASPAFEVQVGLHELLGHGSGKLFQRGDDGEFNFNRGNDINGVERIWYEPGETWESKFLSLASPYEECRAESVGVYLCSLPDVLAVFGHTDPTVAAQVAYVNWLSMARAGLIALEMFNPESGRWSQAHCQARFVILQVLLEAGEGLVRIDEMLGDDGLQNPIITFDGSKIDSVARPAIGKFLRKLQFYKSTGFVRGGREMFERYSEVNQHFLHLRDIVLKRRQPRTVYVQGVTKVIGTETQDSSIELTEYEDSAAGMVQSFQDRYAGEYGRRAEQALNICWERDAAHFVYPL